MCQGSDGRRQTVEPGILYGSSQETGAGGGHGIEEVPLQCTRTLVNGRRIVAVNRCVSLIARPSTSRRSRPSIRFAWAGVRTALAFSHRRAHRHLPLRRALARGAFADARRVVR
jgi:hypothetical protein